MKISKNLFVCLLIVTSSVIWMACDKESEEGYRVDIAIEAPASVQAGEPFEVEVLYTRNADIIHNVLIEIVNEMGHHPMKLEERHVHQANEYTFSRDNVVIEMPGTYTIRASSTDMHEGMDQAGEHSQEHGGEHSTSSEEHDSDANEHNIVEHTFVVE